MSCIRNFVLRRLRKMTKRPADVVIGGRDAPYLRRWHVIPRNRFFNIYFHHFLRSDDDRALHDHPWINISWLLSGSYDEWAPAKGHDGHTRTTRNEGALVFRRPTSLHRIQLRARSVFKKEQGSRLPVHYLVEEPVWTLFITGPVVREWGFACPQGWRHWKDFTSFEGTGDGTTIGKGCE